MLPCFKPLHSVRQLKRCKWASQASQVMLQWLRPDSIQVGCDSYVKIRHVYSEVNCFGPSVQRACKKLQDHEKTHPNTPPPPAQRSAFEAAWARRFFGPCNLHMFGPAHMNAKLQCGCRACLCVLHAATDATSAGAFENLYGAAFDRRMSRASRPCSGD